MNYEIELEIIKSKIEIQKKINENCLIANKKFDRKITIIKCKTEELFFKNEKPKFGY